MKCPVCNAKNKKSATICSKCGNKFNIEPVTTAEKRNLVGSYKISLKRKTVVILSAVLMVLLTILTVLLLVKNKSDRRGVTENSNTVIINRNNNTEPDLNIENSSGGANRSQRIDQDNIDSENTENSFASNSASVRADQSQAQDNSSQSRTQNSSSDEGGTYAIVKDYRLRVRARPSLNSRVVEHLPKDARVKILGKSEKSKIKLRNRTVEGFWYKIQGERKNPDGTVVNVKGWAWGGYLNFSIR